MSELSETRQRLAISEEFFCDGHCYVLTSASLGGSDLTAEELSEILFEADEGKVKELLGKGVCFPVCFEGDCALDNNTVFVLGDLSEQEERDWIARLSWKLNIPCGRLILACGCDAEDLERAVSGEPPEEHYVIYQVIEVSPAEYLVEIYAYFSSMTVQVSLNGYDARGNLVENEELAKWYQTNRPGLDDVGYVIRLKPLATEPPMPELEMGWFGKFEFRPPEF
jgi:hypothetical protein